MAAAEFAHRMVIATQTCESKGWGDENGREHCWGNFGRSVADWLEPLREEKRYGENRKFGTLRQSRYLEVGLFFARNRGINGFNGAALGCAR